MTKVEQIAVDALKQIALLSNYASTDSYRLLAADIADYALEKIEAEMKKRKSK